MGEIPGSLTVTGRTGRPRPRGSPGSPGNLMTFFRDVAPGMHRVEDAYTNWYLVEADDGLTIVDAGVPTSWGSLMEALTQLGRQPADVRALVLTHAHFDHVGFAEKARQELDIPVYAHEEEIDLTRHP